MARLVLKIRRTKREIAFNRGHVWISEPDPRGGFALRFYKLTKKQAKWLSVALREWSIE